MSQVKYDEDFKKNIVALYEYGIIRPTQKKPINSRVFV